jgi:lipoprotein-releasing system permease protein
MMRHWYEAFIGLRYLRASPRGASFVSLIAGIAISGLALGVAVLIVVLSVMNGFEEVLRDRILSVVGHGTVTAQGRPLDHWHQRLATVGHVAGVASAAPYIEEQGMLIRAEQSSGVLLRGVDPSLESHVVDLAGRIAGGNLTDLTDGSFHMILGKDLAEALKVKVGDRVVLVIAKGDVTPLGVIPRMRAFTVSGILSVGMYEYDRRVALLAIGDAAKLLRYGDAVSGIRLRFADMYAAPKLVRGAALAIAEGGTMEVKDWTTDHVNFFKSIEITKQMLFFILLLMVAVAAFNIVSTMVMVVKSKRRDIAILRTFGSSPASVLSVFVIQGSLIGLLGIAAGVFIGVLVAVNLQQLVHGLEHLSGVKFLDARVYLMSDLPAHVQLADVLQICGFAFVLASLSTVYPAVRAALLLPAESLRND